MELIERLRHHASKSRAPSLINEAADALEQATKDNATLEDRIDVLEQSLVDTEPQFDQLTKDKAELLVALKDAKLYAHQPKFLLDVVVNAIAKHTTKAHQGASNNE